MIKHFVYSVFLILFYMQSTYCQSNIFKFNDSKFEHAKSSNDIKLPELNLKEKNGFPEGFFLQLGGEYGIGFLETQFGKEKGYFWNAFIDINLFSNELFLTIEVGQVQNLDRSGNGFGCFSVGLNYRIMKNKQHNIYMHFGLGFFRQPIAIILSSKYMIAINRYIGLSIGPRFIYSTWDESTYLGVLAGIQIFTN